MEPDTAAPGIIDRVCHKMVSVYEHCGYHGQIGRLHVLPKEDARHSRRNQQMQNQVQGQFAPSSLNHPLPSSVSLNTRIFMFLASTSVSNFLI
jgi:hypothetical protein